MVGCGEGVISPVGTGSVERTVPLPRKFLNFFLLEMVHFGTFHIEQQPEELPVPAGGRQPVQTAVFTKTTTVQ